jgi:hypothetical protein
MNFRFVARSHRCAANWRCCGLRLVDTRRCTIRIFSRAVAIYKNKKWKLRDDTRRVFDQSSTGKLPKMLVRTTRDGVPQGNFWNGPRGAHGQYNEAIDQLSKRFIQNNNIKPDASDMTPGHARALLKEIRESQDPRIRNFNDTIRLLRRLFPLRTGRGVE